MGGPLPRGAAAAAIVLSAAVAAALGNGAAQQSPLDTLSPASIPAKERLENQPRELVAIFRASAGKNPVFGVAFSPDGDRLASGGPGQPIQIWNVRNGAVAAEIPADSSALSLAFSADGTHLLALTGDGRCQIWRLGERPGNAKEALKAAGRVYQQLAFSRQNQLAAFDTDNGLAVYDVSANPSKSVAVLPHPDGVLAVSFSGNGKILVSGTAATLHVWDIAGATPKVLANHRHPDGFARAVAASGAGTTVAGSEGSRIRVYEKGKRIKSFTDHAEDVVGLSFVGNDAWPLLSVDSAGRMVLRTEDDIRLMDVKVGPAAEGMAVSHNGRYAATANRDGTVYVFRLPMQK